MPVLAGLMQQHALTTDRLVEHAARWHGRREIVDRRPDGSLARTDWQGLHALARRISGALVAYGIAEGDRIATLAMNGTAHLAAWHAIAGIGAVCHTVNPRLFDDQLAYIIAHAGDRLIFADGAFAPLLARLLPRCPAVERVIFLSDPPAGGDLPAVSLETFIEGQGEDCRWGGFDETAAAGLCYTSGTTGNPKGVLYSHRSNFLHALMSLQADMLALATRDVVLPIVPMFHANAWGLAFSVPAVGAKLVLPGAALDGASLLQLIEEEAVTVAAGVPTVWLALLDEYARRDMRPATLKRVLIGGSAMPEALARRFHALDIAPVHAWGMTEISPIGTASALTPELAALPFEEQLPWRIKQGRPPWSVDLRITDDAGRALPHDGAAMGALEVRGDAVAVRYFGEGAEALDDAGWFDTGDVATVDPHGFVQITDRAKDVIKSGGEWICSLAVENAILSHPAVALAAVIGVPHPRWDERPLLVVQLRSDASAEALLTHLQGRIAKWWVPDRVAFVEAMPLGATGKIDKKVVRRMFG